jgi:hypothetical protein
MKLATFLPPGGGEPRAGDVRDGGIVAFEPPATVLGLLADGAPSAADGQAYALDDVVLMAPHVPRAIFCIGLNYRGHVRETGQEPPPAPVVFLKLPSSVAPPGGPVPRRRSCAGWTTRASWRSSWAATARWPATRSPTTSARATCSAASRSGRAPRAPTASAPSAPG